MNASGGTERKIAGRGARALRLALNAAVLAVVCALSTEIGFAIKIPPHNVSPLWPTGAILLSVLVVTPPRHWWIYVVAAYLTSVLHDAWNGFPHSAILFLVAGVSEQLITAVVVRRLANGLQAFDGLRSLAVYLLVVLLAPVFSAFLVASAGAEGYWYLWRVWFLSQALSSLTVAPAIITFIGVVGRSGWNLSLARVLEAILVGCALVVVCLRVFNWPLSAQQGSIPALVYLPLPMLLWATVRFGPLGASLALLTVASLSIFGAVQGHGPFAASGRSENVLSLQLFLATVSIPLLLLAALVQEGREKSRVLGESEARFRTLADSAPVLIWMSGADKGCTYLSKGWLDFTGRTLAQDLGYGWAEGVHPDDLERCMTTYVQAFDARRDFAMEYRLRRHDGQYRWVWDRGIPRFAADRTFLGYIGCADDITERKWAQERARQVLESAPNAMILMNQDGQISFMNAAAEAIFGYSRDELIGQSVEMLMPERYRTGHPANRRSYFVDPKTRPMGVGRDLFGRRKDGSEFPVEIGLSPIETTTGIVALASIIDTTIRKQAEEDLRSSQRELQLLSGQLIQAQETERRRIARELHDDLNQDLALLSVELDLLGQKPPGSLDQLRSSTRELSARVKQLSSVVHSLSHQLHPAKLEQLGLASAIQGLCNEMSQGYGLKIDFSQEGALSEIPIDVAVCLYRIAQESLQNVIKHSGASRAELRLFGTDGAIALQVADDGRGFDHSRVNEKEGLGLVSMRERLRSLRGEIAIVRPTAGGTQVDVRVPISSAHSPKES